jgi:Carboxypeptidase regulatory-like domain
MEITVGENEIWVYELGRTDEEEEVLSSLSPDASEEIGRGVPALTDGDGRYVLGSVPDVWHRARLEVMATGYVKIATTIFQNEGNDFTLTAGDITIRGTVVDDHGRALVGREVEIDVDSDEEGDFDVEEVRTDAEGRFELTGIPAVDGLEVQVRADEKPRDWDENELTRDRPFIYYLMVEEPITLEPDKKEYTVNIVALRPDITLEIEVRDAAGNPLAGIPVGVCSPGFTEREWYISELLGKTDGQGMCTINEVPRIDPLRLWICVPDPRTFRDWEAMPELSEELKSAIRECRSKHAPSVVDVELEEDKKNYEVSIRL